MFLRLLFAAILFPLASVAQSDTISQTGKYKVSGTIMSLYIVQGGAEEPYPPEAEPFPNCKLYLVKIESPDQIPVLIDSIQADLDGNFEIMLEKGTYGFVLGKDLDSLSAGQYLPTDYSRGYGMSETHSVGWDISTRGPIVVEGEDILNLILTKVEAHICNSCP